MSLAWARGRVLLQHLLHQLHQVQGLAVGGWKVPDSAMDRASSWFTSRVPSRTPRRMACQRFVLLRRLGMAQAEVDLGLQHGERGAQLVRGVGDEAAARGHLGVQVLDVAVDGLTSGCSSCGTGPGSRGSREPGVRSRTWSRSRTMPSRPQRSAIQTKTATRASIHSSWRRLVDQICSPGVGGR